MQKQNKFGSVHGKPISELAQQLLPPTLAFRLFPKLPLELRLAIWHFTFAESTVVKIGIAHDGPFSQVGLIALWIRSESRTETFKHYCVIVETFPRTPFPPKILCFSLSKDIICLPFDNTFPEWD